MIMGYILGFFISFILAIFFVPFSNWLAKKLNIYDRPSKRKIQFRKLTRWGGFGMFLSFFLTLFFLLLLIPEIKKLFTYKYILHWDEVQETIVISKQVLGIFFASLLTVIIGTIDDKSGIKPVTKFLLQIIVAYCAMDFGVRVLGINNPFTGQFLSFPRIVSQGVTILWICGFMNMVNLVDGIDGLSAGIVLISSITFFIISILQKQTGMIAQQLTLSALVSCILAGASAGFLVYNFYPAKLFMGDTGALWLGFIIGCISTVGVLKTGAIISFVVPILVVSIPFVDIVSSIFRRIKKGVSIGTPDKEHIHHLLLSSGWSPREIVMFFYIITLLLSIVVITIVALKFR